MEKINRRKKVVYIIGPFRAKTDHERIKNIRAAEAMADTLWEMGFTVICCHMNTKNMEGFIPDDDILEGDIEIMMRCDFCVTSFPFKHEKMVNSVGSQNEIKHAREHNKSVYDNCKMVKLREG